MRESKHGRRTVAPRLRLSARSHLTLEAALKLIRNQKEIIERLEEEAGTDSLTGLRNQRGADNIIPSLIRGVFMRRGDRRQKRQASITFLFVDIDCFKQFNDTYGHSCGDQVLQQAGEFLRTICRGESDVCWRYGGDEFVVMFNGLSARGVMNRIQEVMGKRYGDEFAPNKHTSLRLKAKIVMPGGVLREVRINFSGGIAEYDPLSDQKYEDTLVRADTFLLGAKSNGRDRILKSPALAEKRDLQPVRRKFKCLA